MKTADAATPFTFDLVSTGKRVAAIFRPYPSLLDERERMFGKPIYVEVAEGDELYPFPRRFGLLGRTWWDLRYVVQEDKRMIAPTILTRDFAVQALGLSVDDSLIGRHLIEFSTKARLVSLNPFTRIKRLRKEVEFLNILDTCIKALGLHDMKIGITGSLLIDQKVGPRDRDVDLVVEGAQDRLRQVANLVRLSFLNKKYNHVWPLKAVINNHVEVDLFFPPPRDLIEVTRSFKPSGLEPEPFTGTVINDCFSLYAPTVLRCEEFVCIVLGTAVRGQYQSGDFVSGCGLLGSVTFEGEQIRAYLVEDAITHLEDAPRVRRITE